MYNILLLSSCSFSFGLSGHLTLINFSPLSPHTSMHFDYCWILSYLVWFCAIVICFSNFTYADSVLLVSVSVILLMLLAQLTLLFSLLFFPRNMHFCCYCLASSLRYFQRKLTWICSLTDSLYLTVQSLLLSANFVFYVYVFFVTWAHVYLLLETTLCQLSYHLQTRNVVRGSYFNVLLIVQVPNLLSQNSLTNKFSCLFYQTVWLILSSLFPLCCSMLLASKYNSSLSYSGLPSMESPHNLCIFILHMTHIFTSCNCFQCLYFKHLMMWWLRLFTFVNRDPAH